MIRKSILLLFLGACIPHGGTAVQIPGKECVECHNKVADTAVILHAKTEDNCRNCHGSTSDWQADITYQHSAEFTLTGTHTRIDCVACHTKSFSGLATSTCATCHQAAADQAALDHSSGAFLDVCSQCHTEDAWKPVDPAFHNSFFQLGFDHAFLSCTDCHESTAYKEFTCLSCHEHSKSRTDSEHRGEENITGYVYESQACLDCHPDGRKEFY